MTFREGRVALVTGGARRIGAAISRRLSGEGYRVALTYRRSKGEAESLAREISGRAEYLDLRNPREFPRFSRFLDREYGRLDLLVHNAAVFPRTPAGSVTPREWDDVFDVNLRAPFLLTQTLLPLLSRGREGAAVLFLGDSGASRLWSSRIPYCLSKIALESQVRAWKKILPPGVRAGIVRPGLALVPPGFPPEEWERLRSSGRPRGPDSPAKVAAAVLRFARGGG